MSEVWLAHDERLDRPVAVKVLDIRLSASGEFGDALDREARTIARLHHPNIVAVYDVGEHVGQRYLVMEYVHGSSLRDLLRLHGRLGLADVVRVGRQAAAALAHAHRQGVVHCDVKPENILVDEQGVVKVTDFGVAEVVTRTMTADAAREVLGTAVYLAPEVLQGERPGPASDVYALALTLYEAAAGRLPFQGPTPAAVAVQRLSTPPAPLRTLVPSAPPELESALARALALDPEQRYRSAAEFGSALGRVLVTASAPLVGAPRHPSPASGSRTERIRVGGHRRGRAGRVARTALAFLLLGAMGAALAFAVAGREHLGGGGGGPRTLPSPSPTVAAAVPSPTGEPSPTATPTPTPVPSPEPSPSPTPTPTPSPTPTETPSPTPPPSPSPSPSPTPTPTP